MTLIPKPPRRARPDFSLTTVNIVFLLLLFYLATGTLITRNELEADIPITKDLPLERLPRPLLLIGDGALFLDGRAIPAGEAAAAARAALEAQPKARFLNVLAERTMPAGAFLSIVARIQAEGVPVRVVTLHERVQTDTANP